MTTYIGFVPQTTAPFQFQPTLDGQPYQATVTWNTYGQRWYLNIYSLTGPLIVSEALVGSADIIPATLTTTAGSYMATVSSAAGLMQSQAINSVNVPAGTTIAILVGKTVRLSQQAIATGPDSNAMFSFDINLVWPFFSSTVIFRESSQQFEISP